MTTISEIQKAYGCDRTSAAEILRNKAMIAAADPDGAKARADHAARMVPVRATYDAVFAAEREAGRGFKASQKAAMKAAVAAYGPFLAGNLEI